MPHQPVMDSVLALLCFDDTTGKQLAGKVEANEFDGIYSEIARKVLGFWHKFQRAPKTHLDDLFSNVLRDPDNEKGDHYRKALIQLRQIYDTVNRDYTLQSLDGFKSEQSLLKMFLKGVTLLEHQHHEAVPEINDMIREYQSRAQVAYDPGFRLDEYEAVLKFLERRNTEFVTGIKELDDNHVRPARCTVMLMLAPTGKGKSWWLVKIGKEAMMRGFKVLHISCEMEAEEVMQRYYQMIDTSTKWISIVEQGTEVTRFRRNPDGSLHGVSYDKIHPEYALEEQDADVELMTLAKRLNVRMGNVVVKKFPMNSLNMAMLDSYLASLEADGFVPDMLVLDYIGVIKIGANSRRPDLEFMREIQEFHGICDRRKLAGVTAQQVNREGGKASQVDLSHIAEAASLNHSCEIVITLSQKTMEETLNLARLHIGKSRSERGKFTVLISQNFDIGQFCLDSIMYKSTYKDMLQREADRPERRGSDEEIDSNYDEDADDE